MKFISKTLSLFFLSSALIVNAKNECDELKNDLGDKVEIIECKNDDSGKINLLGINDLGMKEEDFKKIQFYKTITDFSYTLSNGEVNKKSGYPTSIEYLTNLKNFENLEKLYIGYNTYTMNCNPNYSSYPECYTYFSAPIGKNTFKDLKNLKELSLYRIDLSQDNINEISTLNNLKSLKTESSIFEKISDSKVLNNLDNMNSFTYKASVVGESITILPMELINNIKSLKELKIDLYSNFHGAASFLHDELNLEFTDKSNIENLYLHGIRIKDSTVDEILKLNNLKELEFATCRFDLNDEGYAKLENLGNRCPIKIIYHYCEYQESLDDVNNKNCESTTTKNTSTTTKTTKKTTTTKKSTTTKTTKKTTTTKKSTTTKTTKKTSTTKKSSTTKTTKKSTTTKTTKKPTTTKTTKKTTTTKKSTTTKTTKKSTTTKTSKKTSTKKSTTKTTKNIPISTSRHGECGPGFGACKEGYCCSKYGYCGKTDKYCGKGCQSEYGFCN